MTKYRSKDLRRSSVALSSLCYVISQLQKVFARPHEIVSCARCLAPFERPRPRGGYPRIYCDRCVQTKTRSHHGVMFNPDGPY